MKYCKVFGVLFVSLLVFISCSDDDKPDVPVGDTADRIGVVSKADFDKYVVGKYWKISERAFFDSDGMATDERLSGTFGGTVAQYFLTLIFTPIILMLVRLRRNLSRDSIIILRITRFRMMKRQET